MSANKAWHAAARKIISDNPELGHAVHSRPQDPEEGEAARRAADGRAVCDGRTIKKIIPREPVRVRREPVRVVEARGFSWRRTFRRMAYPHDCTAPANPAVDDIKTKWAADPSASKSRRQCMEIGDWEQATQLREREAWRFADIPRRRIVRVTSDLLYRHLVELASVPITKVRQPAARFQRKRRDPTPQELAALKRANADRKREAAARKSQENKRTKEIA